MKKKDYDKDFLSIKEFAKYAGITIESLRHYDREGVFHPAKRGEGTNNKYRYYSPLQIIAVKLIRVLTEIGVPLQIIKDLNEHRTPEKMVKILSANRDRVANEIRFLQDVHAVINTFTELQSEAMCAVENEITVAEMPEKRITLGNKTNFGNELGFMQKFLDFCNTPRNPKLNLSFPIGGYFKDMAAFLKEPSKPTNFFSLNPRGYEKKPAGLYLIGYNRGYYGQTNDLPQRMEAFAKENGLIFDGPVYNIFLIDEISEVDPNRYLLQVSASVKETRRITSRRPRRQFEYD